MALYTVCDINLILIYALPNCELRKL